MHTMRGYVRNACWIPGSTVPQWLPPHFVRHGLLEGTINDPILIENQPAERMQKQLAMLHGQVLYLQSRVVELQKQLSPKTPNRPKRGLYD